MSSVQTKYSIERRATQQGQIPNRIVVNRDMGGWPAPVFAFDPEDLNDLIRALQSFAVLQGKGD